MEHAGTFVCIQSSWKQCYVTVIHTAWFL